MHDSDSFEARKSAFSMQLPIETEGRTEMMAVSDRLFVLSESSIVEIVTADSVDKDRTNPSVPHTNRILSEFGLQDDFVNRSLIQFKILACNHSPSLATRELQGLVVEVFELLHANAKSKKDLELEFEELNRAMA